MTVLWINIHFNQNELQSNSAITSWKGLNICVVITEECNVIFNIGDLIGATEYLTVEASFL